MAAVTGKSGVVTWEGGVVGLGAWSLDIQTDQHDVTEFSTGTVQWREFVNGISSWTGTANGAWRVTDTTARRDFQNAALAGTTGEIVLEVDKDGGGKFTGGANISGMSLSVDIDSRSDQTYNLQGNGSLAFTTTT